MRQYLNDEWLFTEHFMQEDVAGDWGILPDVARVRLPHTVKETPQHYFDEAVYQMISGYQRTIDAPKAWQGKHVLLTFEGAAHVCEVFLNGEKVGEHRCGYTAFTLDLSEKLKFGGENLLTVKLDSRESLNVPPFGYAIDYMTYGGIYRDVYLEVREPVYVADVFVYGEPEKMGGNAAYGRIDARVTLNRMPEEDYILRQSVRKNGAEDYVVLGEYRNPDRENPAAAQPVFCLQYYVKDFEIWDLEHPTLYELKTEIIPENKAEKADSCTVLFGLRKAQFKADGFYLNGRKVKLRGLNRHQCYPYVGYAMPASMQASDADILKRELGVNAVRTSHYPQSHDFLNRCDELGLLVFTEMPGWQFIGDADWKAQALRNAEDMVRQYRNHPSIILWGVRINESKDDDDFYRQTNAAAHRLDPYRPTGGVRVHKKSSLLEDVYTYNDFLHDGRKKGCDWKADVTPDMEKAYLISEYNGHMYPTKAYDDEEQRREHAIRHANVLDAAAGQEDIAGSFGWCMFDYNTHKDFGSGDRVCYHGVMDMFRNAKPAAAVYAAQQEKETVLELSSSMDIGEHPGSNRGATWIITNADSVRMYKNDKFLKEYWAADAVYRHLEHGLILVDDFIGDAIERGEDFTAQQAADVKKILNAVAVHGLSDMPKAMYLTAAKLIAKYHMNMREAMALYTKYVGDWGGKSTTYRLEAIRGGKVVKTIVKEPVQEVRLAVKVSRDALVEWHTYDVAAVRIQAVDQNGNVLPFYNEPVRFAVEGDIELIGPELVSLQGGMGGTYVKSLGRDGKGVLRIQAAQAEAVECQFTVACPEKWKRRSDET